ncbi:class I SAM-dependent methyltransferase [Hymenobacter caeli]|uniref:Ubiquinone/menaquinone biosynthesis C-methylase UbiE n=1 Tax=Hymenobacter caeli TaxID=2735894 RepID=A0ABX2FPJ3_9BACT|nr:class I SAM-dependent methyltransferase [Hymenobacter caeli]NRT19073.1 ubiquinone/menaquinone biosynthesis C-methylase UbiE [Hymenobacter caeli]
MRKHFVLWLLGPATGLLALACAQLPTETATTGRVATLVAAPAEQLPDTSGYELAPPRDPNGIGKYYLGRQIAHVMGHEGADWLDRSDRREEEGTDLLLKELKLKPTDVVADIGAGTGYFSFQMARLVPKGEVLAVDIQPEMIAELNANKAKNHLANVRPVLGRPDNPNLPAAAVDLVLIVDAYHEFDYPREMGRAIRRALRPGTGRLALVEYRAEDPNVPIKQIHKMSVAQARKEMAAVGLEFVGTIETLPQQHLLLFRRS